MTQFNALFEQFWENIVKDDRLGIEPKDLVSTKEYFSEVWGCVKWPQSVATTSVVAIERTGTTHKMTTGYQLFSREEREVLLKDSTLSGSERTKRIIAKWKQLSDEDKKVWSDKAKTTPSASASSDDAPDDKKKPVKSEKKPHKVSGYNLFIREKTIELKASGVPYDMIQVAAQWSSLTFEQKKEWNDKA